MEHFFDILIVWLHNHSELAGFATFFITFFESIAILGLLIPGSVLLTAIGGLIGSGAIPATQTMLFAMLGAILGDAVSFWVGYRYHVGIQHIWPVSRFPKLIRKGQHFFDKHGMMGLFVGRFIGALRPILPLIAGMLRFSPVKFITIETLSGILWVPVYMLPGILIGAASEHFAPDRAFHYLLFILLGIFALWLLIWFIRLSAHLIISRWNTVCEELWIHFKHKKNWYYRYFAEETDAHNPRPISVGLLSIISFFFLIILIAVTLHLPVLLHINQSTLTLFSSLHTFKGMTLAISISDYLGQASVVLPAFFLAAAYLFVKRNRHTSLYFIFLLIVSAAAIFVLKKITHFARPDIVINPPDEYSFPSGHTLLATVCFGYLAFLTAHDAKKYMHKIIYSAAALLILCVALSRLYLNLHWLSDVLGSLFLGGFLLGLGILGYRHHKAFKHKYRVTMSLIVLAGLIIFGSWYQYGHLKQAQQDDQFKYVIYHIESNAWWNGTQSLFPTYVYNRLNRPSGILNIEWQGSIESIKAVLVKAGWEDAVRFGYHSVKQQLMGENIQAIYPFDQKYENQNPVLVMVKPLDSTGQSYLILHLWNSHYKAPLETIYVGNIHYHFPLHPWDRREECFNIYAPATSMLGIKERHWEIKTRAIELTRKLKGFPCVAQSDDVLLIRGRDI